MWNGYWVCALCTERPSGEGMFILMHTLDAAKVSTTSKVNTVSFFSRQKAAERLFDF